MGKEKIKLKIITHEKVVFDREVEEIMLQGTEGKFGILPNHIGLVSTLDIGITKVLIDSEPIYITTMGGIFKFENNEATILTDIAELGSDIDVMRAQEAKKQAEARLNAQNLSIDEYNMAQISLMKAIARIKASQRD